MLRICGVTFDHTTNYGSCLQAYALQTAIESITVGQGESCNYALLASRDSKKSTPTGKLAVRVKRNILLGMSWIRRRKFKRFEERHMHYEWYGGKEELPGLNAKYDAFVCGSDVIWNFSFTGADPKYFLDFAHRYKFSYAASFGKADIHYEFDSVKLNEPPEVIYSRYLPSLDAVSVREMNAVSIAQRFTKRDVVQVCDPVLLITADEWRTLADTARGRKRKPYIFAYNTSIKPNFTAFLYKLQAQTHLPVVHVTWSAADAVKQRAFSFPDPEKWLSLLCDAEYVVTNSFHATAFATLFHKKFYTVMQDDKKARTNVRLYDYLERLGLEDRIYTMLQDEISLEQPDFESADRVIPLWRDHAKEYIRENLENAWKAKVAHER